MDKAYDQQPNQDPHSTTKRMRMTLACERCRNKKVRCDAIHPECGRCKNLKVPCSYTGTATQFDIFNLAQLNDTITNLTNKVDVVERQLQTIQHDTKTILQHVNTNKTHNPNGIDLHPSSSPATTSCPMSPYTGGDRTLIPSDLQTNWALSLTTTGLRIDTNIVSLQDLYGILLSGASELQRQTGHELTPCPSSFTSTGTSTSTTQQKQEQDTVETSKAKNDNDSSKLADHVIVAKTHPLYRSKGVIFPLYSAWESTHHQKQQQYLRLSHPTSSTLTSYTLPPPPGNSDNIIKDNNRTMIQLSTIDTAIIDQLFQHYAECFLCYPLPDIDSFLETCRHSFHHQGRGKKRKYMKRPEDKINSLLVNAILAWSARHAAIYHDLFPGQDPNMVGEHYFDQAKILLRDCFLTSTLDTVHALLLMYIYSIGKTGSGRAQAGSEAYVFLGLAIRMAMDMGLHRQSTMATSVHPSSSGTTHSPTSPTSPSASLLSPRSTSPGIQQSSTMEKDLMEDDDFNNSNHKEGRKKNDMDLILLEKQRRLFSAIEFMETLCASHSDKPMMLPPTDDVTIGPPTRMQQEQGEQQYRVEFTIHRHQISQIDRSIHDIIFSSVKNPRLSSISHLEQRLKDWYSNLPSYFQYDRHRNWCSTSFREQACLKLTFEYHFQMCQLYSMFLPRIDQISPGSSLSAIALLSLKICVDAADSITDLLDHWAQLQQPWCHFTLGTLVMACGVYCSFQLRSPSSDVVATAKRQMLRIHTVLKSSPVRHHKYVRALIERIERHTNKGNEVATENTMDLVQPTFTTPETTKQPYQHDLTPVVPSSFPLSHMTMPPMTHSNLTPSTLLQTDTPWSWFTPQKQQQQQQMANSRMGPEPTVSPTMAFDMNNDVHLYDLFKFADFVYTPTMDPQVKLSQQEQQSYPSYHPSTSL